MEVDIGTAAGEVYRYLEANGAASASQIKKATGLKDSTINQAIGWLAREDKLVPLLKGRGMHWSLAKA
ncbi:MAG: winged helix-turn-helix domain-containing protein [Candidatus Brocadiia bacterium]